MEWCRLATGAVGVTKMAVGAKFCYHAFQESRTIELFLCMGGAAASALGGWAIINMALYPRDLKQESGLAAPQQEAEGRASPHDLLRAAPHDLLRAVRAHLRNLS